MEEPLTRYFPQLSKFFENDDCIVSPSNFVSKNTSEGNIVRFLVQGPNLVTVIRKPAPDTVINEIRLPK